MIEPRSADALAVLLGAAATASRAGDHDAAIATLRSAVVLAPDDRTAHRRLAAAYAVTGDPTSSRNEYDRFVARLEARGLCDVATIERTYAAALLAPPTSAPVLAGPARHRLTAEQAVALRRIAVTIVAIAAAVTAMIAAGAQIFASGGPL